MFEIWDFLQPASKFCLYLAMFVAAGGLIFEVLFRRRYRPVLRVARKIRFAGAIMRGDEYELKQLIDRNPALANQQISEMGLATHDESPDNSMFSDRSHGSVMSQGIKMPETGNGNSAITIRDDLSRLDEPLLSSAPSSEAISPLMLAVEFAAWSCVPVLIEAGAVDSAKHKVVSVGPFLSLTDAVYLLSRSDANEKRA